MTPFRYSACRPGLSVTLLIIQDQATLRMTRLRFVTDKTCKQRIPEWPCIRGDGPSQDGWVSKHGGWCSNFWKLGWKQWRNKKMFLNYQSKHTCTAKREPVASSASFPIAFCARFRSYTCMRPYFNLSKIENHKYWCKSKYVGTDLFSWEDDTIVFGLEPFHGVGLSQFVLETNLWLSSSTLSDGETWSLHDNVEVHTINTYKIEEKEVDRHSFTPLWFNIFGIKHEPRDLEVNVARGVLCQLTNAWIIFDAQIDMFLNTETEGTSLGEVALLEFVFLDLEATVENLFGLWSTDSAVAWDFFITSDTESTDSVTGLKINHYNLY